MGNIQLGNTKRMGRSRTSDINFLANTRHLTRLITVLSELEEDGSKGVGLTYLAKSCMVQSGQKINDALNWLVSNKIVIKFTGPSGNHLYAINVGFLELRNG